MEYPFATFHEVGFTIRKYATHSPSCMSCYFLYHRSNINEYIL